MVAEQGDQEMNKIVSDPRIDPRIKAMMGMMPGGSQSDIGNREELLAENNTPDALAMQAAMKGVLDTLDNEDVAPSTGLDDHAPSSSRRRPTATRSRSSSSVPQSTIALPCVYYIHGGGMQTMSCFDGMYRTWGRVIAHQGVAVAMVDFRNCLTPSSAPEVAPFPAGLNDCVAGVKLVVDHAGELGIDAATSIVAGESGGGNLTLATGLRLVRDGDMGLIRGLYALVPVHRRPVAAGAVPVIDREQRHTGRTWR